MQRMLFHYQMNTDSTESTPSPPASSSLNASTLPEAPEVKLEAEDTDADGAGPTSSTATITTTPLPGSMDLATILRLFQGNPAFESLLASGSLGDNPTLAISQLFGAVKGSPATVIPKRDTGTPPTDTPKKTRLKVFSNGYFMTFDKISSCGNKHFWRCEYKNTCKARMHTDINSEKIVTYIHEHNHSPPTEEEVNLYGLDPIGYERNRVYVVGNVADPNQRRKIRKQVADQEAAAKRLEQQKQEELQKQRNAATIAAARAVYAQAVSGSNMPTSSAAALLNSSAPSSSSSSAVAAVPQQMNAMLLSQIPFLRQGMPAAAVQPPSFVAQNLTAPLPTPLLIPKEEPSAPVQQAPAKRRASDMIPDDSDLRRDPMFEPTFQIARKLRKLWKAEPSRYPRTTNSPSTHFEFYLSKKTEAEEHLYVAMRIEQRDEAHLREALQEFCGQNCIGMLLFGISPKISVMLNQPMISGWENNQFFLLDVSNPTRWRLIYVDDQAP